MAASTPKRICWDACAWISLIQKEKILNDKGIVTEDRYSLCRVVIDLAEKGKIEIATSALSLAEVCKSRSIKKKPDDEIGAYFENAWVLVVSVDTLVGTIARTLMQAGHAGLKPPDAIHLATAIVANADELHTFDDDILDLDEKLSRQDGNILKICKPTVALAPAPLLVSPAQMEKSEADVGDTGEEGINETEGEPDREISADGQGIGVQSESGGVREGSGQDSESEAGSDEEEVAEPFDQPAIPPAPDDPKRNI